jgi:hypothetical protein
MTGSRRVLISVAALLASSVAGQALAQSVGTYVLSSITGIQYGGIGSVTGVLANDTAATTLTVGGYFKSLCDTFGSTMMSHPGEYTLTLVFVDGAPPAGPTLQSCRLDRNP